jgi:hypothetical protein
VVVSRENQRTIPFEGEREIAARSAVETKEKGNKRVGKLEGKEKKEGSEGTGEIIGEREKRINERRQEEGRERENRF